MRLKSLAPDALGRFSNGLYGPVVKELLVELLAFPASSVTL